MILPGLEVPPQYGWPLLTALLVVIVGGIVNRALKNRPGPPTIPEMWARLEDLEKKQRESSAREDSALTETRHLKEFITEWITRLVNWDTGGRKGRMPLPTDDDLVRLNIKP